MGMERRTLHFSSGVWSTDGAAIKIAVMGAALGACVCSVNSTHFGVCSRALGLLAEIGGDERRAEQLLSNVGAAYRHYDNAAGARFKVGKMRPAEPTRPIWRWP